MSLSHPPLHNDWAAARAAGCVFYSLPDEMRYEQLDPLIVDVCKAINASGWVVTAESCQGHPDAADGIPWAGNTSPMLRLVCRAEVAGEMLLALACACAPAGDRFHSLPLRIHAAPRGDYWFECTVYIGASTVFDRNEGLAALARFAAALQPEVSA